MGHWLPHLQRPVPSRRRESSESWLVLPTRLSPSASPLGLGIHESPAGATTSTDLHSANVICILPMTHRPTRERVIEPTIAAPWSVTPSTSRKQSPTQNNLRFNNLRVTFRAFSTSIAWEVALCSGVTPRLESPRGPRQPLPQRQQALLRIVHRRIMLQICSTGFPRSRRSKGTGWDVDIEPISCDHGQSDSGDIPWLSQ